MNKKGKNQSILKQEIKSYITIAIKNNQLFYNKKQLSFDESNKKKAMLINNKTVLFLSDYDRGIGFYAIRKIELK